MADDEQFSLCWNNFNSNLSAGFHESLCRGDLVDVTLAAEGQFVKAHRLVLSVCSPYFRKMFTQMPANQHAFVFLKDVSHTALKDLIQFMYCGEVNVKQEALPAFISTAEALQIKGLTDSDPPPSQSPAEPSTPTPQIQQQQQQQQVQQQMTSPRVRQRHASTARAYKIETVDDSGDDNKQATQIVIQTTTAAAPTTQHTTLTTHHQQQQQQQQQTHLQTAPLVSSAPVINSSTTSVGSSSGVGAVVTHKRPAQRSIGSGSIQAPHIKRTKSTIDPLETQEVVTLATQQQQQQQQITVVATAPATTLIETKPQQHHQQQQVQQQQQQQQSEPEYIDLPIELPTKSEPDYTEDAGDVESAEQEATYVEDDSYGELRYDESYFTENEDAVQTTAADANVSASTATTSKAIIKQQQTSYSDSSYVEVADQANNDAQAEAKVKFIRSQKKNAQLVYNGYIYNKKLTQANGHTTWRCIDVLKLRCKAVVITKKNELVAARREHDHSDHMLRIGQRPLYNVEEDLGDYIELKSDDPKLAEYIAVTNIEMCTQKNGKEFKLYMPTSSSSGIDIKSEATGTHHHIHEHLVIDKLN